jgi:hypothetical protein
MRRDDSDVPVLALAALMVLCSAPFAGGSSPSAAGQSPRVIHVRRMPSGNALVLQLDAADGEDGNTDPEPSPQTAGWL